MKKIIILGAGPTGLGAAYRLKELGYKNFKIYEKNSYVGGICASFQDRNGFVWDQGGHVIHSHYEYFDSLMAKLLRNDYYQHIREAWIFLMGRFVPYPFQNNIRYLPPKAVHECLDGLREIQGKDGKRARNFKQWIIDVFGKGIAKYFMIPYNKKVWAYPLEKMDKNWIAERVSVVDYERISQNVALKRDDLSWGPNAVFKFPKKGGTGGFFKRFVPYFKDHLQLNSQAIKIDLKKREIFFQNGERRRYNILINTAPLDQLIYCAGLSSLEKSIKKLAKNSVFIVGIGVKGKVPKTLKTKCWIYFPEDKYIFNRLTIFSNYSPFNAPPGCWSLLAEIVLPFGKSPADDFVEKTISGLLDSGILPRGSEVVDRFTYFCLYAYPIPTLGRDSALKDIQTQLMKHNIYSRGRFGAWKYEIGNMDHSVMQGKEVVDFILNKKKERVWNL